MSSQETAPTIGRALIRGWRRRCPQCGRGLLFDGWRETREKCDQCQWVFERGEGDTFGFMYLSAGFFTGAFLLVMFFIWRPATYVGYLIMVAVVVAIMTLSLPRRKGVAIAIEYLASRAWDEEQS